MAPGEKEDVMVKTVVGDVSEEVKENILSLTECVLCSADLVDSYDDFVASKFIECCHSVCRDCVSKWDASEKRNCPVCFLDVDKKLLDNIILQEIVDGSSMKKKVTFCSSHTANLATHWCYDCGDSICEECIKLKKTQNHVIKTKEEHWNDPSARYMCRSHPKEQLKLFCLTCSTITCRDCQLYHHRDHIYDFISEIVDTAKKTLHRENVFLRYQLSILENAVPMIEERKKKIEDDSETIAKAINDTTASLIVKITKKKHSLLSRLRAMSKSQMETYEKNEKEIKEKLNTIKHCTSFTLNVLKNNSDFSIVHSKAHILRHIERIKSNNFEIPNPACSKVITFKDNTIDIVPGYRRQPGPVQGTVGTVSLKDDILVDLSTFVDEIEKNLRSLWSSKSGLSEEIKQEIRDSEPSKDIETSTIINNEPANNGSSESSFVDQVQITSEQNNVGNSVPNALFEPPRSLNAVAVNNIAVNRQVTGTNIAVNPQVAGSNIAVNPVAQISVKQERGNSYECDKIDQMPLLSDLLQTSSGKDFPVSRSVDDLFSKSTQRAKDQAKSSIDDEIFKLLQGDETPLDFGEINANQEPIVSSGAIEPPRTGLPTQPMAPTTLSQNVGQIRPIQTSMLIKSEEPPQQNNDYLLKNMMANQDYRYLNENQLRVLKPPLPYMAPEPTTWYRHPVQPPQPQFMPQFQPCNRPVARAPIPPNRMISRPAVPNRLAPPTRPPTLIVCSVCLKPRPNVMCQMCKRNFHRNCSFFPSLKNYQNNQMQQTVPVPNCILCERIPMISKPYPFPMNLLELKVCSRVLVQILVTRHSQAFYTNPLGPTRLSGLKMKLFDKMEGFKGGVDEFVKQLKALYQERYDKFKDKMTTQQLEMIYNVTLNVIKTFLPESSDDFIRYMKQQ